MQQAGEDSGGEEILGAEIADGRAHSLGVCGAALTVPGSFVTGLRHGGGQYGAGIVEGIDQLFPGKVPLLFPGHGRDQAVSIIYGLIIGNHLQDPLFVERDHDGDLGCRARGLRLSAGAARQSQDWRKTSM